MGSRSGFRGGASHGHLNPPTVARTHSTAHSRLWVVMAWLVGLGGRCLGPFAARSVRAAAGASTALTWTAVNRAVMPSLLWSLAVVPTYESVTASRALNTLAVAPRCGADVSRDGDSDNQSSRSGLVLPDEKSRDDASFPCPDCCSSLLVGMVTAHGITALCKRSQASV